ncbi:uncharacterized protein isoform X2 [Rhodnius prolixus]|uniref:uncharacterized protein isoform X2 n=1 Tax=Rhodnius prolixus TaxID=13249 RepID=UPI003D18C2F8
MVTVDTDDEMRITPNLLLDELEPVAPRIVVPPKRLKLLSKRYARTNLEEERPPHGRGSSGFAAEQMTIDSEYEQSVDHSGSPPLPDSPTLKVTADEMHRTCIVIREASIATSSPPEESICLLDKRQENMRLLEVATTLTEEQLNEFDMRYGSPHHNRSQSVRPRSRPNYLSLPQARTRVASMPNTGAEETYYRLRHFSITCKGVVNRGDSLRARRTKSGNSISSQGSDSTGQQTSSRQSSCVSCPTLAPHKVLMLGSADVGKTSLISQFMTSEFLHAYDNSIDEEAIDKSVSVLLDGEETELVFVDHPYSEMSPTTCLETYKSTPAAFCVVYSTADKASFKTAEKALQQLWKNDTVRSKAVILVANKADLVRSRVVSNQEGKRLATSYDCKYIETSVGFNHNVDELLVGIVSQVRLKQDLTNQEDNEENNEQRKQTSAPKVWVKARNTRTSASLKVKGLLSKVWASHSKSKSCENLHVL